MAQQRNKTQQSNYKQAIDFFVAVALSTKTQQKLHENKTWKKSSPIASLFLSQGLVNISHGIYGTSEKYVQPLDRLNASIF